jgi:CheY-like chemotaxis protein
MYPTDANSARNSILVAEDDRVMSDMLRFTLERAGYAVTLTRNGDDAWQALQAQDFDLLVTDYQMPGRTGLDIARGLRQEQPDRNLPIILLSARGLELNASQIKQELSISAVLFKPYSPMELVQIVSELFHAACPL